MGAGFEPDLDHDLDLGLGLGPDLDPFEEDGLAAALHRWFGAPTAGST